MILQLGLILLSLTCGNGLYKNLDCSCVHWNECTRINNDTTLYPCENEPEKVCCPNRNLNNFHKNNNDIYNNNNMVKTRSTTVKYEPFNTIVYFKSTTSTTESTTATSTRSIGSTRSTGGRRSTTEINGQLYTNRPNPDFPNRNFNTRTSKPTPTSTSSTSSNNYFNSDRNFRKFFRKSCGMAQVQDKITGGKVAEFGQFPWMALLGFRVGKGSPIQFLCGGSLITKRHVLTAAHCLIENLPYELIVVRLGEFDVTTQSDCEQFGNDTICADQPHDIQISRTFVHPNYNRKTLKNDIAVIKMQNEVMETEYVRTICLPFNRTVESRDLFGRNFTVSGWGKSKSSNLFGSDKLQFTKVQVWEPRKCNETVSPEVKPLDSNQICANGENSGDACKGDSGGPLINTTLDFDKEFRSYQIGIVSFGTSTCGDRNLPTIYTRVDKYLDWIIDKVLA